MIRTNEDSFGFKDTMKETWIHLFLGRAITSSGGKRICTESKDILGRSQHSILSRKLETHVLLATSQGKRYAAAHNHCIRWSSSVTGEEDI